uniref:Selenoprotein T n=1 Tax=Strigamia maritima TaxID=126957 RepID=T1JFY5_STRMM
FFFFFFTIFKLFKIFLLVFILFYYHFPFYLFYFYIFHSLYYSHITKNTNDPPSPPYNIANTGSEDSCSQVMADLPRPVYMFVFFIFIGLTIKDLIRPNQLNVEGVQNKNIPATNFKKLPGPTLKFLFCVNPFNFMGTDTPGVYRWFLNNKMYSCMMIYFLSNVLESQLISTGAFEIEFNDVPVWSKLETGRIPSPPELFQIIDSHKSFKSVFCKMQPNGTT